MAKLYRVTLTDEERRKPSELITQIVACQMRLSGKA
jgi:hypothetical protein